MINGVHLTALLPKGLNSHFTIATFKGETKYCVTKKVYLMNARKIALL
jgi:hypothetical protein